MFEIDSVWALSTDDLKVELRDANSAKVDDKRTSNERRHAAMVASACAEELLYR